MTNTDRRHKYFGRKLSDVTARIDAVYARKAEAEKMELASWKRLELSPADRELFLDNRFWHNERVRCEILIETVRKKQEGPKKWEGAYGK